MTRINSIYGFQPLSAVFACKTTTLGPELQVCMGPSSHLWICAFNTAKLSPELQVSMGHRLRLWICAHKTACLAPE